jgi:hypothetical protein
MRRVCCGEVDHNKALKCNMTLEENNYSNKIIDAFLS